MKSLHGRPLEPLEEMLVIAMLVFSMVSAGRIHNHRTTTSNQSPDKEWKLQQFSTHGKSRSTLSSDKHGFPYGCLYKSIIHKRKLQSSNRTQYSRSLDHWTQQHGIAEATTPGLSMHAIALAATQAKFTVHHSSQVRGKKEKHLMLALDMEI